MVPKRLFTGLSKLGITRDDDAVASVHITTRSIFPTCPQDPAILTRLLRTLPGRLSQCHPRAANKSGRCRGYLRPSGCNHAELPFMASCIVEGRGGGLFPGPRQPSRLRSLARPKVVVPARQGCSFSKHERACMRPLSGSLSRPAKECPHPSGM